VLKPDGFKPPTAAEETFVGECRRMYRLFAGEDSPRESLIEEGGGDEEGGGGRGGEDGKGMDGMTGESAEQRAFTPDLVLRCRQKKSTYTGAAAAPPCWSVWLDKEALEADDQGALGGLMDLGGLGIQLNVPGGRRPTGLLGEVNGTKEAKEVNEANEGGVGEGGGGGRGGEEGQLGNTIAGMLKGEDGGDHAALDMVLTLEASVEDWATAQQELSERRDNNMYVIGRLLEVCLCARARARGGGGGGGYQTRADCPFPLRIRTWNHPTQ
jgi:hypothetical protein